MKRRKDGRKDRRSGKRRSKSCGGHGHAVLVFEPEPGGILYISFRDQNTGREVRRSLGHRDWKRAVRQAEELSAQFLLGVSPKTETLGRAWQDYLTERSVDKNADSQQHDRRTARAMLNFFGEATPIDRINRESIDRYMRFRGGRLARKSCDRPVEA